VLRGEVAVAMRRAVARSRATGRSRGVQGAQAALSSADTALMAQLKAWRLAEARAQLVPAFVILNDRTLTEIARRKPCNTTELSSISGIGAAKLARYGDAVLAVVAAQ
jgi:ATP-dependent DNA helicase RecQ